ncbi:hypothetical protein [Streptomyces sp. CBMA156]|uniref:hypothetical protein n=1 Tax=Streptomyces sp. CBMA156 TaxID=1930280 RepID=UPI001661AE6F|nr:hypothetical protein [Streptomyces sp. CBMA156]MBD0675456.1 hypothetical protein [Streptomyces sp. CBMA156]
MTPPGATSTAARTPSDPATTAPGGGLPRWPAAPSRPLPPGRTTGLFAVDRDTRIAVQRRLLHERSETLANLPEGSRPHTRLLAECEDISDEIARLRRCVNIPRSVALAVPALIAVLLLAAIS